MSMIRCDLCNRSIDSDFDAECFVEGNPSGVFCEPCRDKAAEECAIAAALAQSQAKDSQ